MSSSWASEVNEDMASVRKFLALRPYRSIVIIAFGIYFLSRSIIAP
jgi:hypothetical protein